MGIISVFSIPCSILKQIVGCGEMIRQTLPKKGKKSAHMDGDHKEVQVEV